MARSPFNGEIFEVAGAAVSRIVFAGGPIAEIRNPEDMIGADKNLFGAQFEAIDSLATSVSRKLAFSTVTEPTDSSQASVRTGVIS